MALSPSADRLLSFVTASRQYLDKLVLSECVAERRNQIGSNALSANLHRHELPAKTLRLRAFVVPLELGERPLVSVSKGVASARGRSSQWLRLIDGLILPAGWPVGAQRGCWRAVHPVRGNHHVLLHD